MIEQLLEEIREWLGNRIVPEKELEKYFTDRGFFNDDISYIKREMLNSGFSFMNDKVRYRGDNVVPMPQNQNPMSQENLIKKYKGK